MDEIWLKPPKRRTIDDINVIPIVDLFTTIIFFLLISSGFVAYTKLSLPPSIVSAAPPESVSEPPLSPRVHLVERDGSVDLELLWFGSAPGRQTVTLGRSNSQIADATIREASESAWRSFAETHDHPKAVQLGLSARLPYRYLIAAMDGLKKANSQVVLISYNSVERGPR